MKPVDLKEGQQQEILLLKRRKTEKINKLSAFLLSLCQICLRLSC